MSFSVGFFFDISRFYCRLYLYPYKVLYPAGDYAVHLLPHAPFYYFFNGMLLFLFGLNVWWFHFIILLMWKVLTGQRREIEDTRDVGIEEVRCKSAVIGYAVADTLPVKS